jgi:RDD family
MNDSQPSDFQPKPSAPVDNTAAYHKRFLAFAIDMFLLLIAMTFVMHYLGLEPAKTDDIQAAQVEIFAKLAALSDGKRIMGIAIVTLNNQKPAFLALIAQRYLTQWLMGIVPVLGPFLRLVDVLFIFRADKRCLHDQIAKTKVIDLSIQVVASPNSFIA